MSFWYLASPYSSPWRDVREGRFLLVRKVAAVFVAERIPVYSPIVHGHTVDAELELAGFRPPDPHTFWLSHDIPFLDVSRGVLVLCCQGWKESAGVQFEIDHINALGKPLYFLEPAPFYGSMHEARTFVRSTYSGLAPASGVRPAEAHGPDGVDPAPRADAPDSGA